MAGLRKALAALVVLAICLAATLLWRLALAFADSEADEIPVGFAESLVWYSLSTGAMLCSWAAAVQLLRGRCLARDRLLVATAVLDLGFWVWVGYLVG